MPKIFIKTYIYFMLLLTILLSLHQIATCSCALSVFHEVGYKPNVHSVDHLIKRGKSIILKNRCKANNSNKNCSTFDTYLDVLGTVLGQGYGTKVYDAIDNKSPTNMSPHKVVKVSSFDVTRTYKKLAIQERNTMRFVNELDPHDLQFVFLSLFSLSLLINSILIFFK
jgi:hypothetical protein